MCYLLAPRSEGIIIQVSQTLRTPFSCQSLLCDGLIGSKYYTLFLVHLENY